MSTTRKIVNVVRAVEAVRGYIHRKPARLREAQRRKPARYSPYSFYGLGDLWMFNAVLDQRLCDLCLDFEKTPRFLGIHIRSKFPYHEIMNKDTIQANVHPNCRCNLTRVKKWSLDDIMWFLNLELE